MVQLMVGLNFVLRGFSILCSWHSLADEKPLTYESLPGYKQPLMNLINIFTGYCVCTCAQ